MKTLGTVIGLIGFAIFIIGASLMDSTGVFQYIAIGMALGGMLIGVIGGIIYDL